MSQNEAFWAAMALYALGFYMGYRFHKKHGGKEMKPCEACGYRDRCQTKQYKKDGGCDLFWLNPNEYKKTDKEEKQ